MYHFLVDRGIISWWQEMSPFWIGSDVIVSIVRTLTHLNQYRNNCANKRILVFKSGIKFYYVLLFIYISLWCRIFNVVWSNAKFFSNGIIMCLNFIQCTNGLVGDCILKAYISLAFSCIHTNSRTLVIITCRVWNLFHITFLQWVIDCVN